MKPQNAPILESILNDPTPREALLIGLICGVADATNGMSFTMKHRVFSIVERIHSFCLLHADVFWR